MLNAMKSLYAGKTILQILFFFLLVTQISFAQWVQLGVEDKAVKDIAARNSVIFVVTSDSALYRSTNNGINWSQIVDSGAVDIVIAPSGTVFMLKEVLFLGGLWNRLFSSSDNGATWDTLNIEEQIIPPGWESPLLMNVSVSANGIIYCGLSRRSSEKGRATFIASSTDDGTIWTTPGDTIMGGHLFDYKAQFVISAGFDTGLDALRFGWNDVYLSTDNGSSWTDLGVAPLFVGNCHILSLCLNKNILLGGTPGWGYFEGGLFLSNDSCTIWTKVCSINIQAGLSMESGGSLIGTDSLGVFLFNDYGDSLGAHNDGLTNLNIHTLAIDNNGYVYAGTNNGVWRRPLSEITSAEEEKIYETPTTFFLSNNYPNPFNPSTRIKYSIPQSSKVVLKVFDVLGNEIETLVSEDKRIGSYEVNWNAANLPSGVYFYQFQSGSVIQTKKMLLLK